MKSLLLLSVQVSLYPFLGIVTIWVLAGVTISLCKRIIGFVRSMYLDK